jgi:hypothetical protein
MSILKDFGFFLEDLLGPTPAGTGIMALDPTFGSFHIR